LKKFSRVLAKKYFRYINETVGNFDHLVYTSGENISLGMIDQTAIQDARIFFNLRYWGAVAAVKYAAPHILQRRIDNHHQRHGQHASRQRLTTASSVCGAIEGL